MKKKYFTPEMEELELGEPVVLDDLQETSNAETGTNNQEGEGSL